MNLVAEKVHHSLIKGGLNPEKNKQTCCYSRQFYVNQHSVQAYKIQLNGNYSKTKKP